jgi:hypothetical protein
LGSEDRSPGRIHCHRLAETFWSYWFHDVKSRPDKNIQSGK